MVKGRDRQTEGCTHVLFDKSSFTLPCRLSTTRSQHRGMSRWRDKQGSVPEGLSLEMERVPNSLTSAYKSTYMYREMRGQYGPVPTGEKPVLSRHVFVWPGS